MNENRNNSGTAGGIGFCGLLTIAFIILKLTGVISWSWLWVLAPIWIPTAIVLAVLLVVLIAPDDGLKCPYSSLNAMLNNWHILLVIFDR